MNLQKFSFIAFLIFIFFSCRQEPKKIVSEKDIQVSLQQANKQIASEQKLLIEQYCKRRKWKMKETGSGLYYMKYDSLAGKNYIKSADAVSVSFTLKTLEGKEIYSGNNPHTLAVVVENSNAETGIHELLQKMKKGEKAIAILPSHLAFGLTGDENIPPFAVLVYDIKVSEK